MHSREPRGAGGVLLIAGPRAGGKTYLAKRLIQLRSDMVIARGVVTRPSRAAEDNNDEFVSDAQFDQLKPQLCLTAEVNGYNYGYIKNEIDRLRRRGLWVIVPLLFAADVEQSHELWPSAICIYLRTDTALLRSRLLARESHELTYMVRQERVEAQMDLAHGVIEGLNTHRWDLRIDIKDNMDTAGIVLRHLGLG